MISGMRLHPATQILTWCVLVAAMQFLPATRMLVAGGFVLLSAFILSPHKFKQLVRRTRWIMFSLWLIYAYSTPGQNLFDSSLSPSREGLMSGALQLMRLLVALAGLAILLDRLHRQQLISGLYSLLLPLQWLGLSRERFAVRLALTLHYAEVGMLRAVSWQDSLRSLTAEDSQQMTETAGVFPAPLRGTAPSCCVKNRTMELPVYRFAFFDILLLAGVVLFLWLLMR